MIRITDTPNTTQSDTTRIRDLKLMDLPLAGSGADGALISYQSIGDRPPSFFDRPSFFFFLPQCCFPCAYVFSYVAGSRSVSLAFSFFLFFCLRFVTFVIDSAMPYPPVVTCVLMLFNLRVDWAE
jgi:drug/metabolite transporter (DMT)-like permease